MSISIHDASPLQLAEHLKRRERLRRFAERAQRLLDIKPELIVAAPIQAPPDVIALEPQEPSPAPPDAIPVPWMDDNILSIQAIKRAVAKHFKVTTMDIDSARRNAKIMRPRQITYYLAKTLTRRSLPEIGRRIGSRDHTTILSGVRKIESLIAADPAVAACVEAIRLTIAGVLENLKLIHPELLEDDEAWLATLESETDIQRTAYHHRAANR
jgi:hypothetical protein